MGGRNSTRLLVVVVSTKTVVDALFRSWPMNQRRRSEAMESLPHAPPLRRRSIPTQGRVCICGVFDSVYQPRHPYFVYFCGGFDQGYKRQRAPVVVGLTICTICASWREFGFGLAAPIFPSLPPHYILTIRIVGVGSSDFYICSRTHG